MPEKDLLLIDWRYTQYVTGMYVRIVRNIVVREIYMTGPAKSVR